VSRTLPNVIHNTWRPVPGRPLLTARILDHKTTPEGLDVERIRFRDTAAVDLDPRVPHLVSILSGQVLLTGRGEDSPPLTLGTTTHAYVPPDWGARLHAPANSEILRVSGASAAQAGGDQLLVRDERFVAACASESQMLRWILTSQYLSRRIFLHHDRALRSRSGAPVSWYRTTMFDVAGLPLGNDGEAVFRMAYSSRTEFNVCYDVRGEARVRMAEHPYREHGQAWGPWLGIDGNATYHVNEAAGGEEEERWVDEATGEPRTARNKHEVHIADGYVTLFCLFDPAPTGMEQHQPGRYSDYEPLAKVVNTQLYAEYSRAIARLDPMVDRLSMASARGELEVHRGSDAWRIYEEGRAAQVTREEALLQALRDEGRSREAIVAPWRIEPELVASTADA
jgi:hypothetical protein